MKEGILIGLVIIGLLVVSYLVTVGVTWLVLLLVGKLFGVYMSYNIWLLGALVWIIATALKQIFGGK